MGDLLHDVRYGIRTLLKSPGFTIVAVIALALGIGANTAMFGIVNAVLLRPIPYPEPDRLLQLYSQRTRLQPGSVSYPNFLDWQRRSRSFQEMAAYRTDNFNLTGQANPERLRGAMASARLFAMLGMRPIVGRTFTDEEDRRGAAPVAVVTSTLWKTRFGGDPAVVGSRITLNGSAYTITGVVPADDVVFRRRVGDRAHRAVVRTVVLGARRRDGHARCRAAEAGCHAAAGAVGTRRRCRRPGS